VLNECNRILKYNIDTQPFWKLPSFCNYNEKRMTVFLAHGATSDSPIGGWIPESGYCRSWYIWLTSDNRHSSFNSLLQFAMHTHHSAPRGVHKIVGSCSLVPITERPPCWRPCICEIFIPVVTVINIITPNMKYATHVVYCVGSESHYIT
jgi:hypothetical protein